MNTRTIVVHQDFALKAARGIAAGVLRFAANRPDWNVRFCGIHLSNDDMSVKNLRADALITGIGTDHPDGRRMFQLLSPRAIAFTFTPRGKCRRPFCECRVDDRAVGETAAKTLLAHGLEHFAFLGSRREIDTWSENRLRHFSAAIRKRGKAVAAYRPAREDQTEEEDAAALEAWLAALPKPCGLFVSYDHRALHALNACRRAGIAVPEQVQILGVDNESWLCEWTRPTLSSIEIDFVKAGYSAAEAVDAMLSGKRHARLLTCGIKEVVERLSTSDLRGYGVRAAAARELIRKDFASGLTVEAVARQLGCSQRMLESSYRAVFGKSPKDELSDTRLAAVKDLLAATHVPLGKIHTSVGLSSASNLARFFQVKTGLSMSAYRAQLRVQA